MASHSVEQSDINLQDMSVEDFLSSKWDCIVDDDEELMKTKDDIDDGVSTLEKTNRNPPKASTVSKAKCNPIHQKELDSLKDKDPEFYRFLQQEDETLLQFGESFDDYLSSDDDEVHVLPDTLEEASDNELDDDDDDDYSNEVKSDRNEGSEKSAKSSMITVSNSVVEEWKEKLSMSCPPLSAIKGVIRAFRAALEKFSGQTVEKSGPQAKSKFKVESAASFNAVVGFCLQHMVPALDAFLNFHPGLQKKRQATPKSCKRWIKIADMIQLYLTDVIELHRLLLEPTVVCATLRHIILLVPYFISIPKITKILIKDLMKTWSSAADESCRVLAFLCMMRIVKFHKDRYLEPMLRQCYFAYVLNCKFSTPSTLPMINFMQRTLCELCAVDVSLTYQLSFLYIRQLAIHLRKAMMIPKTVNYQAVYNWQFVHSLGLWCQVVGHLNSSDTIKPLLFPLVQVSLAVIELVSTAKYFPLRYRILRYLALLADKTDTYIPLLSHILLPLKLSQFNNKKLGALKESLQFSTILKLSNSQLKESSYLVSTMDEMYSVLMDYLNTYAHRISFPEMTVTLVVTGKKYLRKSRTAQYTKLISQLLQKVEENTKYILLKRSQVVFDLADSDAVSSWERSLKDDGVPFQKYYQRYRKMRHLELKHDIAEKDGVPEERLPTIDRAKFSRSRESDKKFNSHLFEDDSTSETSTCIASHLCDGESSGFAESSQVSAPSKVVKRVSSEICEEVSLKRARADDGMKKVDGNGDELDVVEDIELSSDEE